MVRRTIAGYVVLISVFALGAAAGSGATYAYAQKRNAAILRDDGRALDGHRLAALARRLDLDPEQEGRVAEILARDREASRALSRGMIERCGEPLREHKAAIDAAIREVLNADQQRRFDGLREGRRERIWFGGSGRGGR
jgi:hypothetical protein